MDDASARTHSRKRFCNLFLRSARRFGEISRCKQWYYRCKLFILTSNTHQISFSFSKSSQQSFMSPTFSTYRLPHLSASLSSNNNTSIIPSPFHHINQFASLSLHHNTSFIAPHLHHILQSAALSSVTIISINSSQFHHTTPPLLIDTFCFHTIHCILFSLTFTIWSFLARMESRNQHSKRVAYLEISVGAA